MLKVYCNRNESVFNVNLNNLGSDKVAVFGFNGIDKTYAIQAGREVRVIVKPDQVDDAQTLFLAKDIARKIEQELEYPGQIKVNVIRECRGVEYAK